MEGEKERKNTSASPPSGQIDIHHKAGDFGTGSSLNLSFFLRSIQVNILIGEN